MESKMKLNKKDIATLVLIIVVSILLIPMLCVNVTLIVKGSIHKDQLPSVFGVAPLAVETGSMAGDKPDSFNEGALIFVKLLDDEQKQNLKEGDIVTYKTSDIYVTHRIIMVNKDNEDKIKSVITQGDANNGNDGEILLENIVGVCTKSIEGLGSFTLFLQTPIGTLVFVGIPIVLFIIYDILRIRFGNKKTEQIKELDEKDEEIKRLKALLENGGQATNPSQDLTKSSENTNEKTGEENSNLEQNLPSSNNELSQNDDNNITNNSPNLSDENVDNRESQKSENDDN